MNHIDNVRLNDRYNNNIKRSSSSETSWEDLVAFRWWWFSHEGVINGPGCTEERGRDFPVQLVITYLELVYSYSLVFVTNTYNGGYRP